MDPRHTVLTQKRNFFKSDAQDINTMEREYLAEKQLKLSLLTWKSIKGSEFKYFRNMWSDDVI